MQASEGPIQLQWRIAVGLRAQGRGGKELLGPRQVVTLLEGEHGGDKPCGSLAIGANGGKGVVLAAALLPLAVEQEMPLGSPQQSEAFSHDRGSHSRLHGGDARVQKGSLFTNWMDGNGPETSAGAGGGGLPQ